MGVIAVVGAVILREGRILGAKRKEGRTLGGLWEFPGGKVEEGEDPLDALTREIREELDAEVEVLGEILTVVHEYDFARIELTTFQCELRGDRFTNKEHEEIRWIPVNELDTVEWTPADLPTIEWIGRNLIE